MALSCSKCHQSADKFYNAGITKEGSKVAKWISIEIISSKNEK